MTTTYTVDKAFAYIDRLTKHGTTFAACAGLSNRVLIATRNSGGAVNFTGTSALLTGQPLDVASNGTPSAYYVLTPKGITTLSTATNPAITAESVFDTGSNRWLFYSSGNLIAPLANGGIRLQTAGGTVLATLSGILSESTVAAFSSTVLYVFDGKRGKMAVITVSATALTYEGTIDAPNCREVLRAVIDGTDLYCVNRHRVARFSIATPTAPTLAQSYPQTAAEFTDVAVISTGKLWFGFANSTPGVTGPEFFGPLYGVYDTANAEIQTSAPKMSAWMVSNVIPYYTPATIPTIVILPPPSPIPVPVPPVIAPPAPVITSSLTASATDSTAFSYTIAATGMGPIYFDTVSPPLWLTGINHLSGVISGIAPGPGMASIVITAANVGGRDTETLAITINNALANMSAVGVSGAIVDMVKVGTLLYIVGGFTSVTDASGTKSRSNAACLDLSTGLWAAWNPSPVSGTPRCIGYDNTWIYLGGVFTVVNGVSRNYVARVHPTTGANDTWNPTLDGPVFSFLYDLTSMWVTGGFTNVNASPHEYVAKFDPLTGNLNSWRAVKIQMPTYADRYLTSNTGAAVTGIVDRGSTLLLLGGMTALFQDGTGLHYLGIGFLTVNKTTGDIAQSTNSANVTTNSGHADIGGITYTTTTSGIISYENQPSGTTAGSGLAVRQQFTISGTLISTAFSPAFYPFDTDPILAYAGVGSNVLMGGTFTRLGGDTTKRILQLVTPTGALVPGFTATWSTANASVYKLLDIGGGVIAIGGDPTGVTLNGAPFAALAFINGSTGTRY